MGLLRDRLWPQSACDRAERVDASVDVDSAILSNRFDYLREGPKLGGIYGADVGFSNLRKYDQVR